jgi:hypothetical protein
MVRAAKSVVKPRRNRGYGRDGVPPAAGRLKYRDYGVTFKV